MKPITLNPDAHESIIHNICQANKLICKLIRNNEFNNLDMSLKDEYYKALQLRILTCLSEIDHDQSVS